MKALITYGSPHGKNSATYRLASKFGQGLRDKGWETDEIMLSDANIAHCKGCYSCWMKTPGVCCQKDDMEGILERHKNIDLLVLATPLYFYSSPGIVKDYWDRNMPLYFLESQKYAKKVDKSWTDTFKFMMISTCGFPQKTNFDGLVATARKIYSAAYEGEMLVPLASTLSQDFDSSKYPQFYDFMRKIGGNYADSKSYTEESKKEFELFTSQDNLMKLFYSK